LSFDDSLVFLQAQITKISIIGDISNPGQELMHDWFFKIFNASKLLPFSLFIDQFDFDIISGIGLVKENLDWYLVSIIVLIDKPVVEEET
jgi:hypothetical protein